MYQRYTFQFLSNRVWKMITIYGLPIELLLGVKLIVILCNYIVHACFHIDGFLKW